MQEHQMKMIGKSLMNGWHKGGVNMLYYKVKLECDQKKRHDGSILIANELYTPWEKRYFVISDQDVDPIHISKRSVYFSFGARFEK